MLPSTVGRVNRGLKSKTEELGEEEGGKEEGGKGDSELPTSESASSNDLRLNLSPLAGHILLRTDGLGGRLLLTNTPQTTQPIVPKYVHLPDAFSSVFVISSSKPITRERDKQP